MRNVSREMFGSKTAALLYHSAIKPLDLCFFFFLSFCLDNLLGFVI